MLKEDCRCPQNPDSELRDYWTQQKRLQEQLEESSDSDVVVVTVPKKRPILFAKKKSSGSISAVAIKKPVTKLKSKTTKAEPKPAVAVIIKVSDDDDDDKHKRKLNLDLDALDIRERELKRREDVLFSKESAVIISKDENESKLSSSCASSVFNNVSNSAAISNFNDPKQNNLMIQSTASFSSSRDCQLMMMLFGQEIERNNQKFQECDRRLNQSIQESDRKRSNDLLLRSMEFISANNK